MKGKNLIKDIVPSRPFVSKITERNSPIFAFLLIIVLISPVLFTDSFILTLTTMLIWGLFAAGFDFMFGYTGEVSFGHSAFFGLGAYTFAILLTDLGIESVTLLLAISFMSSFVLAAIIGMISFRASGVYFAILTLAWAELVHLTVTNGGEFTGGSDGLGFNLPEIGIENLISFSLYSTSVKYYLTVGITFAMILILFVMTKSQFGLVMKGINENSERLEYLGYNVKRYKIFVFSISGGVAGTAGALIAITSSYAAPSYLEILISGEVILYTVIGGAGTLVGPFAGAGAIKLMEDMFSVALDWWFIPLNLLIILTVIFLPEGVAGRIQR